MARGFLDSYKATFRFLDPHKATFKMVDDFLVSLRCQASRFADGLSRELMMKRNCLGRKPEGASISHNPYITGLQVAANGKCLIATCLVIFF